MKIEASLRPIMEQGKCVGSEAMFGYAKKPEYRHKFIIAGDEAEIARRVTDPKKWIITENHHEPIVDRETFDRAQARFGKRKLSWKRKDGHVLVGRPF